MIDRKRRRAFKAQLHRLASRCHWLSGPSGEGRRTFGDLAAGWPARAWGFGTILLAAFACDSAMAGNRWVVCDLSVRIEHIKPSAQRVAGRVHSVKGPADSECPTAGDRISFLPETLDYQRVLPRKQWPKAGALALIRYRYLIGACKHTPVCKIEHHSVVR